MYYHFDVTCVKLEEVEERLNRLYDRVENLLYIDKLFELTEELTNDSFNDSKDYNVNFVNITTADIDSMGVEEQMVTLGMTKELDEYLHSSSTYKRIFRNA